MSNEILAAIIMGTTIIVGAFIGGIFPLLKKKRETGVKDKSVSINAKKDSNVKTVNTGDINAGNKAIIQSPINNSTVVMGDQNKNEIINNYIIGSSDYNKIVENIKELEQDLTELSLTPERRNQKAKKLAELRENEKQFKEQVFSLYETFTKIKFNTERLKKAKEHFDKGEFKEADAILKAEELAKDQRNLLNAKEQQLKEVAELDKNLKNNANEYLIKAKLTALQFDLQNRFEKACNYFEHSINSFKTDENLFEYAYFLQRHNQFNKAIPLYKEVLQIYRGLSETNPHSYLPDVAMTLNNLGALQAKNNKIKEAFESFNEALQIYRRLSKVNPQTYLPYVAMTLNNLGALQADSNKIKEALQIYRGLAETNPQTYLPYVANTLNNLSIFYIKFEPDRDKSIACAQEALNLLLSFPNKTYTELQYIEQANALLRFNKAEIKE